MLWGSAGGRSFAATVRFLQVFPGPRGTIHYSVRFNDVTGLFRYDPARDEEQRLFHRNGLELGGMDYSPTVDRFVAEIAGPDGARNLFLLDDRGRIDRQLTSGDARDVTPSFTADGAAVLYASSGLSRSDDGSVYAWQPLRIMRLDLASGEVSELAADPTFDYLLPRPGADGAIVAVRRPHRPLHQRGLWQDLKSVVLFPVLLVLAIIGFVQAFIRMFNRSPLATAGASVRQPKRKFVEVFDEVIDCARLKPLDDAIVPEAWSLVQIGGPAAVPTTIAQRVLDHRMHDGRILVCTGRAVRTVGGQTLARGALITSFALGE
ncbi:MAG: hypothetical protein H0W72_02425 [Planctomycetes bacterium]|nr:hypothetical protein [Planctomycetota bacterium]